jgi:carbamoyl-phosphate synthase small subunit
MSGYQEILTDPSYCGQIVTMTMPQIGNYGVNPEDMESSKQHLSGFVVKELSRRYSNHRATGSLHEFLESAGIIGLAGVGTRTLTKRLRERGALRGVISTEISDPAQLVAKARTASPMEGQNLVEQVRPNGERVVSAESARSVIPVVAMDCGIKSNILRELASAGCQVRIVPPTASVEQILASNPRGLLVGNGPGDPAAVTDAVVTIQQLVGRLPIFGICLGHQLLSLALGAKTFKLKFGHHGANHPVLNTETGRVEITSQNHGFAVDIPSLEAVGGRVTHINLYDRSLEGFAHPEKRVFAVQYHPEAAPGPHDSGYLFEQFVAMVK